MTELHFNPVYLTLILKVLYSALHMHKINVEQREKSLSTKEREDFVEKAGLGFC